MTPFFQGFPEASCGGFCYQAARPITSSQKCARQLRYLVSFGLASGRSHTLWDKAGPKRTGAVYVHVFSVNQSGSEVTRSEVDISFHTDAVPHGYLSVRAQAIEVLNNKSTVPLTAAETRR